MAKQLPKQVQNIIKKSSQSVYDKYMQNTQDMNPAMRFASPGYNMNRMMTLNRARQNINTAKQITQGRIPKFKKGGKVKKTGLAVVLKGEIVVPKELAQRISKIKHPVVKKIAKQIAKK